MSIKSLHQIIITAEDMFNKYEQDFQPKEEDLYSRHNWPAKKLIKLIKEHGINAWEENGKIKARDEFNDEVISLPNDLIKVKEWLGY